MIFLLKFQRNPPNYIYRENTMFTALTKVDIQIIISGVLIFVFGIGLAVIAINLYRKIRELMAVTARSEEELEKIVKAKTKELSTLHDLTTVINRSLKVEEILKAAVSKVIEITDADAGAIHVIDSGRSFLNLSVSENLPAEISLRLMKIPFGEESLSVAAQKKAVTGIETSKYPQNETFTLIGKHGFRYISSIPIIFKDTALGIISILYKKQIASDEKDALLRSIGMEIGIALNNALLFEKVENAKKEWEATFDTIKDLLCLHDKDLRIIRCNTSFMEYVGLKPPEIMGREYFKIFPKTDTPLDACLKAKEQGEKTQEEVTDINTGKTFLIDMYPVYDKSGKLLYSVHSAKDMTEIKQAKEDLEDLLINTITSLVSAIDAKSPWTKGHSERVTYYARKIGSELGLSEKEIETLTLAGLLHDIGKLGTYDAVLDKPDKLTAEEFELVKKHPVKGIAILSPIKQLKDIIPIIRHHHEKYDGKGYPDGLKGEEIPLSARILCAADSFDAMTAKRPYKAAREMKDAKEELKRCAGIHFDPDVVEAFITALEKE